MRDLSDSSLSDNSLSENCGLFGKLPMQGDFISHFLPDSFTDYWHGWLQACLMVSCEQLGDQWQDFYLTAPVWHFAIMPGIVHEQAAAGVMIPSVDEVGRYFPLTLVHLGPHRPWHLCLNGRDWFRQVESTALQALADDLGYAAYMEQFEHLRAPELPQQARFQTQPSAYGANANRVLAGIDPKAPHTGALQHMDSLYERLYGAFSLWWTEGSDSVDPCLLVSSHLPDSGQFAAMLDGKWQQWQWSVESIISQ